MLPYPPNAYACFSFSPWLQILSWVFSPVIAGGFAIILFFTIRLVVLPAALPGMLTGAILGLSRAAGETAAIMFTASVFFAPKLPKSIFSDVMALPYHIYVLATAGTEIEKTRPLQYGTALVLIALVLGMNLVAILLRARLQKKH